MCIDCVLSKDLLGTQWYSRHGALCVTNSNKNNNNLYSLYSGTKERQDKKETIENEIIETI